LVIINHQPSGFAFVVDNDQQLKGVVTDGDIRRFLLKGFGLNHTISDLDIPMCTYAYATEDQSSMLSKMNEKIRVLPIVDERMAPIDYLQFDERRHIPVALPNLEGNEVKYVTDAVLSTWISSSGKYIDQFESEFSKYIGTEFGVATSNGTTALHLALMTLGIGEGDEVIVPDLTFAATINTVLHAGATPVIVDVELDSWCISPEEIIKALTPKTKAVIPVHLYGQACDMGRIMEIAKGHDLFVIEDCAEAHGAEYQNQKVGSFGDIACFSFFGNKIITTGEGGMCLANSEDLDAKMRQYRDHGMSRTKRYWHDVVGYNYRMTNVQAAIGCAQLERIGDILSKRQKVEEEYRDIFEKYSFIKSQQLFDGRKKVSWLVSVTIDDGYKADDLIDFFQSHKIDVRRFFYPLSEMPIYSEYLFSNQHAKSLSKVGVNFPTHTSVDFNAVDMLLQQFAVRKI
jgi:perosamine synthetase